MRATRGGATILVVDDVEANRRLLQRRMEREGYRVVLASDGEEALAHISDGGIDLVLLDVMMPGLSGVDVVERVRATRGPAELPVVMVTAVEAAESIVEALDKGANDYVSKPFDAAVLRARVRNLLRLKELHDLRAEFVRMASHDLKNPLTNVMMALDLVRGRADGSDGEMIRLGLASCEHMESLIADFLDMQALQDGRVRLARERVVAAELLRETVDAQTLTAARKQVKLSVDAASDITVFADRPRVRQVLANLVSNLVKFSPPGAAGRVRATRDDSGVRFEVIDEGPGLADGESERIFGRWARGSSRPTGDETSTGLGLWICKEIVKLHGGAIGAENNEPGPGATFWFTLPDALDG